MAGSGLRAEINRMRRPLWLIIPNFVVGLYVSAQVNVLTYHNNNARTGQNLNENLLTPANVNASTFGKLFAYSVDGYVYAQPLYVSGLSIPGHGARNVVFVATQHNSVYALDADNNGGPSGGVLWQVNLGPSAATPTTDFGNRYGAFDAIVPEIGITSTPLIDLSSGTIYVDTFTHEGTAYLHKLRALNLTNGAERPLSPVLVAASIAGTGVGSANGVLPFNPRQHIQRSALTLAGGRLYLAFAGYADTDPYHGWVIGFDPANLQQLPNYVFNTTPNSTVGTFGPNAGEGGIWMAGCGLSEDASGSLYFACGNGSFNALNNSGGTEYGSSFIRLSTATGLTVADYFTPYNQQSLADNDLDVGSGGVLLVPDQPGSFPRQMIGGTKAGRLYVMNRDMLTAGNNHYNNGGSSDAVLQTLALGRGVFATPAYFNGRIYCAAINDVLVAFSFVNGVLSTSPSSISSRRFAYPGATPSVSASGSSNGIVWALQNGTPGVLAAFNATNLASEIYNSTQAAGDRDRLTDGVKFTVPSVANGKVFVGGRYALSVFGLRLSPYDIWKSVHFGANAGNPTIAGNTADPDSDRLVNIWEYGLGSDPNRADSFRRPMGSIVSNRFRLQFSRNLGATNLSFTVQRSPRIESSFTTLLTWTASAGWTTNNPGATVAESAAAGAPPDQYVSVSVSDTAPATRSFFRVLVNN
jgi:hypothetical protein